MSSAAEAHLLARIAAAPLLLDPFPHCIVDRVFPEDFFEQIIDQWPQEASWEPLSDTGRVPGGAYRERMVVRMNETGYAKLDPERRGFWRDEVGRWLHDAPLRAALLDKFAAELGAGAFGARLEETRGDALIVSDRTAYAIGPHTDAPHRVVSLLFYLPEDDTFRRYGTSLYVPEDASFRCAGGPHHAFAGFRRVKTAEFLPNRLVVFPKSDRCFHGVERVDLPGIDRRLLIYNVRRASSARTRSTTGAQSPARS